MSRVSEIANNIRPTRFDKFVFWACIIDTMFLPSVWFISIPYTMPLIFYWASKRQYYLNGQKEFKLFKFMLVLMFFSTLLGLILNSEYIYKNIVYIILFTTMFLYYFLYKYYISRYNFSAKTPLLFLMSFIVILAILFNIDKSLYQNFKVFWNPRSNISINAAAFDNFQGYRYSFIYWDPNNVAYLMNAIVLYLFLNERTNLFVKVVAFFSLLFVLISCMSNGGFITLGISIAIYVIIISRDFFKSRINFRISPILFLMFVSSVALIAYIIPKIPDFQETVVAIESKERLESNSGDSRIRIWEELIDNVNFIEYVIIGKGGTTIVKGGEFAPHNGHFYWILGYGFISYYIFMYLIFRKRKITPIKNYVWIIILLFGFTVNVMLGEIKLMGVFLLMIACSTSPLYLFNSSRNN